MVKRYDAAARPDFFEQFDFAPETVDRPRQRKIFQVRKQFRIRPDTMKYHRLAAIFSSMPNSAFCGARKILTRCLPHRSTSPSTPLMNSNRKSLSSAPSKRKKSPLSAQWAQAANLIHLKSNWLIYQKPTAAPSPASSANASATSA